MLKHKTAEMNKNLERYQIRCEELDKPADEANYRKDLVKSIMRFLVFNAQK